MDRDQSGQEVKRFGGGLWAEKAIERGLGANEGWMDLTGGWEGEADGAVAWSVVWSEKRCRARGRAEVRGGLLVWGLERFQGPPLLLPWKQSDRSRLFLVCFCPCPCP